MTDSQTFRILSVGGAIVGALFGVSGIVDSAVQPPSEFERIPEMVCCSALGALMGGLLWCLVVSCQALGLFSRHADSSKSEDDKMWTESLKNRPPQKSDEL